MSKEGSVIRKPLERDIQGKIDTGEIATLHLPAQHAIAINRFAKGESLADLGPDNFGIHASTFIKSLQYLRDAFEVKSTEQALSMLVARGYPLGDDVMPESPNPTFSKEQLEVLKRYVEGKSYSDLTDVYHIKNSSVVKIFSRMKAQNGLVTNIQLAALATNEGFLQPQQQEDGTFTFETEERPHPKLNPRQKKILVDRFHNIPENYIADELGIYWTTVQQGVAKARKKFKVNTTSQLVLRCLELGELDIDELTEAFDLERAKAIRNTYQVLLEKSLEGGGKYESDRQIGKVVGLTHNSVNIYKHRIIETLGVKTYLQAMILYKAAVEKGIIPPYETEKQNGYRKLPDHGVIFPPDPYMLS